jgi:hypothetical protein
MIQKTLGFDNQKWLCTLVLALAFMASNAYAVEDKCTSVEAKEMDVYALMPDVLNDTIPSSAKSDSIRRAEALEKKRSELKALFSDGAFGRGASGQGKGSSGKPISKGDPAGVSANDKLDVKNKGTEHIGGGLTSRGIVKRSKPLNPKQETGIIVIKACVDHTGKVISASYIMKGSTTNSESLRQLAIEATKKWQFNESELEKQCGTISYVFKEK